MAYPKQDALKPFTISMRPTMARRVMRVARQRNMTRSEFIRGLVEKELDRPGDNGRQATAQKDSEKK